MSDVGDEKDYKKKKTAWELQKEKEEEYLRVVLSTVQGRDVMWRVLEFTGLYHTSYDRDAPHETSFREGKRQIGLLLLSEINNVDPLAFQLMQKEHLDE